MPGSSTHSRKNDNCPQCGHALVSVRYDVGWGVTVPTRHCDHCKFNLTDANVLEAALKKLRDRRLKDTKVIAVGEGLGVRFPKEIVEAYTLKKGAKITMRPKKNMIEIVLS